MLILGSHLDIKKPVLLSLQAIYGINQHTALVICSKLGLSPQVVLDELTASQTDQLTKICQDLIGTQLFRQKLESLKSLMALRNYRGTRHMVGLPTRGQRTRTNAATVKRIHQRLQSQLHTKKRRK